MKRNYAVLMAFSLTFVMLAGCGQSKVADNVEVTGEAAATEAESQTEPETADESKAADDTKTEEESQKADTDGNAAASADSSFDEEEEEYYDGPDFESAADEFYGLTRNMCIEDAAQKYAITLVDGGKYADYEGDIGDVIPEYKDKDLDGDHKSDVIRREGHHYVIEFSKGGSITTDDFSSSPNEGEIIEFQDLACRNVDEILIAHYTFGTGGSFVWDTAVYSNADGEWKAYPLIDKDNVINSKELRDYIAKKTGKAYEPGMIRVAGVEMTTLLLDFGMKDGSMQTYDYEPAYLNKYFRKGYVNEREDFAFSSPGGSWVMVNCWPFEVSGDPVKISSNLQYKLNVYMSNFSEQRYMEDGECTFCHFAMEWAELNSPSDIKYENNRKMMDHGTVNKIAGRYFGASLDEGMFFDECQNNPYGGREEFDGDKTWYSEPAADGEMYRNNYFTVVTCVEEILGDRERNLRVDFDIYSLDTDEYDEHGIGKAQYSLSAGEAKELSAQNKLFSHAKGFAILEDVGEDGYWMMFYHLDQE